MFKARIIAGRLGTLHLILTKVISKDIIRAEVRHVGLDGWEKEPVEKQSTQQVS